MPPVLPPRATSQSSSNAQSPTHLRSDATQMHPYLFAGLEDPRSTSTQSLLPTEAPGESRRTLLVVYIHGFMGTEDSFHSFPAHVHSLLTITLAESHVVHTKIYPRYQSRKNISFARDAFSNWLYPHESENTDVILAGHSLGGILAAEVVLLPSHIPGSTDSLQHRILGLIAFDTPFLGLHPGIVTTGIASLFRGNPAPVENALDSVTSPSALETATPFDTTDGDPNYNPAYSNDVKMPIRKNKWERAWYFWNKHGGDLKKATQSYLKSHVEFGGCLTDYPGLRRRYEAVRSMEDVSDLKRPTDARGKLLHRVRFVNYYTASSGRIKEQKSPSPARSSLSAVEMQTLDASTAASIDAMSSATKIPRLSVEEHRDAGIVDQMLEVSIQDDEIEAHRMEELQPEPCETSNSDLSSIEQSERTSHIDSVNYDDLPPIHPEPESPTLLDLSQYSDADALGLAQKENTRRVKAFNQATKDRDKMVKERERIIAKRKLQAEKDLQRAEKHARQEEQKAQKEEEKRQATLNLDDHDRAMNLRARSPASGKGAKLKDRKFCTLPTKNQNGRRDETWVRVYMEGIDEVAAHTSLFNMGDTYSKLVGDTAERIEEWIRDDASIRIILLEQDSVDD